MNRTPTQLKKELGTLNVTRENKNEPVLGLNSPTAPKKLDNKAKKYFAEIVQLLEEMRVITVADVYVIQVLASQLSRYEKCNEEFSKLESLSYKSEGREGTSFRLYPQVDLLDKLEKSIHNSLGKLGLTPADRQRVSAIPETPTSESELELFK